MYNETFSFLNQTGSGHDEDQPIVFVSCEIMHVNFIHGVKFP